MKPENIFLLEDGSLKLGDFGISKILATTDKDITLTSDAGTLYYMPPETFKGKPASFEGDIWAVGCIIREIIEGSPTFYYKSKG